MAENKTPQPLTRGEFEAGVKFCLKEENIPSVGWYMMVTLDKNCRIIEDKRKYMYCHIQYVEDDGFVFIQFIFHNKVEGKVFFKDCIKL